MISQQDIDRLIGADAVDPTGDRIGSIENIYLDEDSGQPEFALVNTGLFGTRSSFVPLHDAEVVDGGALRVAHEKDVVTDAPSVDVDQQLRLSDEQELFRYYGMNVPASRVDTADTASSRDVADATDDAPGTVGHDTSGPTTDDAMTRSEEELQVETTDRETGRVRLRKHVVTEHVQTTVPVRREEIRIEREPVTDANLDAATDGPAISEEEHEVVLHEEEVVVEKRVVPKERVRLDKDVVTEEVTVEDDVRREEIDVAGLEESREPRDS